MSADIGYTMAELLRDYAERDINPNPDIFKYLSNTDLSRLKTARQKLQRIRDLQIRSRGIKGKMQRGRKSNQVGKRFEQLIQVLLDGCTAIKRRDNIRSTISEIDFRISVEPIGITLPMLKSAGTHAIGEAKCLTSGVKTEWINELVGVLTSHNATLAILFTACPSKPLRTEHRTAIALQAARGFRVVPFGMKQVQQVEAGQNFLAPLSDQYVNAMTHGADLHI